MPITEERYQRWVAAGRPGLDERRIMEEYEEMTGRRVLAKKFGEGERYATCEVGTRPMTVADLRAALADHPDDAYVVTEYGDCDMAFAKEIYDCWAGFSESPHHMIGDAEVHNDVDPEKRKAARLLVHDLGLPEGYMHRAVFIYCMPSWHHGATKEKVS